MNEYMNQALQLAREAANEGEAVSYTHLDVYKRQVISCGCQPLLSFRAIAPIAANDFFGERVNRLSIRGRYN